MTYNGYGYGCGCGYATRKLCKGRFLKSDDRYRGWHIVQMIAQTSPCFQSRCIVLLLQNGIIVLKKRESYTYYIPKRNL